MGREKRIGIVFAFTSKWLGGVYYLVNLVNSFSAREPNNEVLPKFIIFYSKESEAYINLFSYKNIEFQSIGSVSPKMTFLKSLILGKNYFIKQVYFEYDLDGLYPFNDFPCSQKVPFQLISWYPDLQHKFYPEYFKYFNLLLREFRLKSLIKSSDHLVLSSNNVLDHFQQFYDLSNIKTTIMPFVSLVDKNNLLTKKTLEQKFNIEKPYFLVSNQFYRHKDHITLLKALAIVRNEGFVIKVLMTGLMDDYRSPKYINHLKRIISDNKLEDVTDLLGIIPRNEQLSLMKYALATIQPSLFEGWSTVIEDVKALNGNIIASDIEIHKEQLGQEGILFRFSDAKSLANTIKLVLKNPARAKTSFNYGVNIKKLSLDFEKLFR